MIANEIYEIVPDDLFLRFDELAPRSSVYLKVEGLNAAGSVKLKTAVALVAEAEASGWFPPGRLIESTSGNLGVALAVVCAAKGYPLTCVTDPNTNAQSVRIMEALGVEIVVINTVDENGGFLQSRVRYIRRRLAREPGLYWPNQYASAAGPRVHRDRTAQSIFGELGHVDYVFIGAGTTGTLMGCADFVREHSLTTRIIAVDIVGSVTFGGPATRRHIPGLGTSRRPEILNEEKIDKVIHVTESETIAMCRRIAAQRGILLGGSSGTVLAAVQSMAKELPLGSIIVAISPDLGDRYLETIYNDTWVAERWPQTLLVPRVSDGPKK
ncbi:2,3-diaminopropionate biosynthesis protein SbnA [Streptomyces sp. NBC_01716]|uniref:2,3-diaminopropionate biosynthesis protein SbnA n=1 Tax=Streptomyces sp. NBC_01716 TaxID=2975917 RepID=UPI002E32C0FB|nr:2,3-diaminopropionate biosynthesis protein SbnA [Streptomyces sp. NBC_01716]